MLITWRGTGVVGWFGYKLVGEERGFHSIFAGALLDVFAFFIALQTELTQNVSNRIMKSPDGCLFAVLYAANLRSSVAHLCVRAVNVAAGHVLLLKLPRSRVNYEVAPSIL